MYVCMGGMVVAVGVFPLFEQTLGSEVSLIKFETERRSIFNNAMHKQMKVFEILPQTSSYRSLISISLALHLTQSTDNSLRYTDALLQPKLHAKCI